MEKSAPVGESLLSGPRRTYEYRPRGSSINKRTAVTIFTVTLGLLLYYASRPSLISLRGKPSRHEDHTASLEAGFDWLKIQPQEQLTYHACFGGLQCARVSVPLNWNDTSGPATAAVAVIKVPARVPVTDPRYGGAVVLNPGGPGNSGVGQVVRKGRHMQTIVDAPRSAPSSSSDGLLSRGKYFDIIGFDARGVNNTTPHLKCFPNKQSEVNFLAGLASGFHFGISDTYIDLAWAQYRAFSESCAVHHGDEPNMAEFVNTAQVVEDIVAIIERHAQWRETEAQRILNSRESTKLSPAERRETLQRTRWQKGSEKLNYWGVSYGTILGQTFAAMHPDRVSRVLIDGVADVDDYYAAGWLKNLQDTDQIMLQWAIYCQQAPEACPLALPDKPSSIVTARIARLTESLLTDPIPVAGTDEHGPMVIGYEDVMDLLGDAMYNQALVEPYFEILKDLQGRNATSLAALRAGGDLSSVSISDECKRDGVYSEACVRDQSSPSYQYAIACTDGPDLRNTTKADFREYFKELRNQSDVLGATWSGLHMICMNWQARPAWRVEGPWMANTSNPLLIVGNTYDPVTPLRNAHRASTLFPGSVVLQQNTEGHGLHAAPSICTGKAVRAYFQDGTLPEIGTVCEPEHRAWIGCVNPAGCDNRSEEDQQLWESLVAMRTYYR